MADSAGTNWRAALIVGLLVVTIVGGAAISRMMQGKTSAPTAEADAGAPWSSTCTAAGRDQPVGCSIEQRVVLRATGQLLTLVRLNFSGNTPEVGMVLQTPFGLALRSGISLQIDNDAPVKFDVQACDQGGCYAGGVVPEYLISRLSTAKVLTVHFVGVNKRPVDVPVSMNGFAPALQNAR
jgi:invasion protein IalB